MIALKLIKTNSIVYFNYLAWHVYGSKMFYMFLKNKMYCVQWGKKLLFSTQTFKNNIF